MQDPDLCHRRCNGAGALPLLRWGAVVPDQVFEITSPQNLSLEVLLLRQRFPKDSEGWADLIRIIAPLALVRRGSSLIFSPAPLSGSVWILPGNFTLETAPEATKTTILRDLRLPPMFRCVPRAGRKRSLDPFLPLIASRMQFQLHRIVRPRRLIKGRTL